MCAQVCQLGLAGDSTNRWFDKSLSYIVFQNGLAASNCDVSTFQCILKSNIFALYKCHTNAWVQFSGICLKFRFFCDKFHHVLLLDYVGKWFKIKFLTCTHANAMFRDLCGLKIAYLPFSVLWLFHIIYKFLPWFVCTLIVSYPIHVFAVVCICFV